MLNMKINLTLQIFFVKDKATISNIKHEAESSEVKKNFEDEFHEERIATLLNEIQTLYEDLRRNLLEKEKASKLLSFEKSNAKHVGMELSKLLGDESGAVSFKKYGQSLILNLF